MGMLDAKFPETPICGPTRFRRILKSDHSGRIFLLGRCGTQHYGVRQVSVLSDLTIGESGILVALNLPENVQNHLMHMGFVPGSPVIALRRAPAGDPTVYLVDGLEIALRHETAAAIRVRPLQAGQDAAGESESAHQDAPPLAEAAR